MYVSAYGCRNVTRVKLKSPGEQGLAAYSCIDCLTRLLCPELFSRLSMAERVNPENIGDLPSKPCGPSDLRFPSRSFGIKSPVHRYVKSTWLLKWPWLHYNGERRLWQANGSSGGSLSSGRIHKLEESHWKVGETWKERFPQDLLSSSFGDTLNQQALW